MEKKEKIDFAESYLKDFAKDTTDATAFIVERTAGNLLLKPDLERRANQLGYKNVFYHIKEVGKLCVALGLSTFITSKENSFTVFIY